MKKKVTIMLLACMTVLLAACGKKGDSNKEEATKAPEKNVAIAEIVEDVKTAYGEDFVANNILDDTTIKELIGIDASWCDELYVSNSMIGMQKDMLIAVKAKSADLDKVLEAVNTYRENMIADTMQYPMNMPKIQASRIDQYGNYVFFTILGFIPSEVEEKSDEEQIAAYKAENEKAVAVYDKYLK